MNRRVAVVVIPVVAVGVFVLLVASWLFMYGRRAVAPGGRAETAERMAKSGSDLAALTPGIAEEETAGQAALAAAQPVERKLIKTGRLELVVQDLDATVGKIRQLAEDVGGFVSSHSFTTEPTGWRRGQVTVRIPSSEFDGTIQDLEKCGQVTHVHMGTQDVTEEYIDLEARLRNLEREEEVLLGLFNRPSRLQDVLAVEKELARVRGDIEQAQGRLRYLKRQVSLSTIEIDLNEMGEALIGPTGRWRLAYHIHSAGRVLVAVARVAVIVIIYVAVVGSPLWAFLGIWALVRRRKGRAS